MEDFFNNKSLIDIFFDSFFDEGSQTPANDFKTEKYCGKKKAEEVKKPESSPKKEKNIEVKDSDSCKGRSGYSSPRFDGDKFSLKKEDPNVITTTSNDPCSIDFSKKDKGYWDSLRKDVDMDSATFFTPCGDDYYFGDSPIGDLPKAKKNCQCGHEKLADEVKSLVLKALENEEVKAKIKKTIKEGLVELLTK